MRRHSKDIHVVESSEDLQQRSTSSLPTPGLSLAQPSDVHIAFPALEGTPVRGQAPITRTPGRLSLFKSGFTSRNSWFHRKQSASPSPEPKSSRGISSGFSKSRSGHGSTTERPESSGKTKEEEIPDLSTSNKRAEGVHLDSPGQHAGDTTTHDLELLQHQKQESKKLLAEAMYERSRGNFEICRAKCVQIVKDYASVDVETTIYAYNILSTQASPGQADRFLDESLKLVRRNITEKPELERLLEVIESLRDYSESKTTRTGMRNNK